MRGCPESLTRHTQAPPCSGTGLSPDGSALVGVRAGTARPAAQEHRGDECRQAGAPPGAEESG